MLTNIAAYEKSAALDLFVKERLQKSLEQYESLLASSYKNMLSAKPAAVLKKLNQHEGGDF